MGEETAVLLNISDMIDLAIGSPEVGIVDFNMLQTVLHCLAQQQRILNKYVELRGSAATLPIAKDYGQTINVSEFMVNTDDKSPPKMAELLPPKAEPETILVAERVKKVHSPPVATPRERSPPPRSATTAPPYAAPPKPDDAEVEPPKPPTAPPKLPATAPSSISHGAVGIPSSEKLSLVTISKFNVLENTVEDLRNRVYGSMPKNEEILEEVRSQTNLKAITDMWTSLNVSSRLEAAEAGISKLSSLVQDLIGESAQLQEAVKRRISKAPGATETVVTPAAIAPSAPSTAAPTPMAPASATLPPAVPLPAADTTSRVDTSVGRATVTRDEIQDLQAEVDRMQEEIDQLKSFAANAPTALMTAVAPISAVTPDEPDGERRHSQFPRKSMTAATTGLTERINDLEKRLKECCDKIGKKDGLIHDQMNSFQDQLEGLMKQVASLTEDLGAGKLSPDLIKDLQGLMQLFQTVQEMQGQLKQVHDTALQLAAEKEDRKHHINALLEQIELLKNIKLDREDMVEAMAEKADLRMLARKVSHDQFELACDDLSRGLEHALGKLNMQEALWQQALDDIQREIESKLDKVELSPVKDFFNSKLRQLQENLKQMSLLRREAEAAGTKRKLLRDVNCISCDANAIMSMEAASTMPVAKPMPASFSMKPYLSYELDAIRKSQASNLPQRNMHDWETIDKQMSGKHPQKVRSDTGKHLCNRYCGGSHTTTTPAQRVARLGHFIKQWGPDVLPLSSGLAAGDDGRMYKVNTTEGASVGPGGAVEATCAPKSPPRKSEVSKQPQKPMTISAECRCLEGDRPPKT